MAPGTRPGLERSNNRIFPVEELFEEAMDVPSAIGDPWLSIPGANNVTEAGEQGFEDSFILEGASDHVNANSESGKTSYESNTEYLNYLESKLKRIEKKRTDFTKVSSTDVLKSLKDVKEKQLQWNFRQGISSSEDDTLDSDSSGGGNSLTNELRRKMFPEQHALNETELLHLLEHDAIGKIFNRLDSDSSAGHIKS